MAKNNNLGDFLTDIANAIREKKGTSGSINAQDFASEIASISTGGGDMPVIGDGKTYLYIKIAEKGRMNVPLYFSQTVANGVTIDWGDGSATQTLSGTGNKNTTHTYADVGDYTISLNPSSGCTLGLGHNSSSYCVMGSLGNSGRVYCNMLQAVEVGKNVTSIDEYAFRYCYSLASIVIPDGVISISDNAFNCCYSLSNILISEGVTSIGRYAFSGCHSLSSIVIPDGVISIYSYAFRDCYSLESIVIPDSITFIDGYVFRNCYSLVSIVIPEGVTSISTYAFNGCYSLSNIVIPEGVTSISTYAFGNCWGMAYYDFRASKSVPTLSNTNAFSGIPSDCKIVVPDSLYDTWVAATNWSTYANNIIKASEFNG